MTFASQSPHRYPTGREVSSKFAFCCGGRNDEPVVAPGLLWLEISGWKASRDMVGEFERVECGLVIVCLFGYLW